MIDETERPTALRTIAWVALLVVIGGALGNCEARAECDPCVAGREARTWIARALIAEAGWTATQTEYVALAWVLAKRWHAKVRPHRGEPMGPGGCVDYGGPRQACAGCRFQPNAGDGDIVADGPSFVDIIRTYCSGLGRHAHTPRQQWVRELPADGQTRPEHWPDNARWEKHAPRWRQVLRLVDEWAAGEHPDPCPRARHFGGDMDEPRGRMKAVCARLPAANNFYGVM